MVDSLSQPASEPKSEAPSQQEQSSEKPERGPLKVAIVSQVAPPPGADDIAKGGNTDKTPRWKKISEFSALAVAVIVALIYGGQLCVMNRQLGQMQSSSGQTRQLICLYAQQLATLQQQNRDTHILAIGSLTQAAAVTRAESAQIKINRNLVFNFLPGKEIAQSITISNIGNTAALNLRFRVMYVFVDKGKEPDFVYPSHPPNHFETGFVYPGDPSTFSIFEWDGQKKKILSDTDYSRLQKGSIYPLTYGRIGYQDIFGNSHWTKFCVYGRGGNPNEHQKCAAYNRVDNTTVTQEATKIPSPNAQLPANPCPDPKPN